MCVGCWFMFHKKRNERTFPCGRKSKILSSSDHRQLCRHMEVCPWFQISTSISSKYMCSQHVSMPNMMHTCRHSIVGRERENYCIWTYLLFIPHTKLEITCNPKVISNNSLDTRINSKKTLNYSTWCQLRWIIHEPTRSQVLRLDGRTIYSYIILFPFLPVVKVHVVVTRPHIDSCKWLGPKWPRRNFNAY